MLIFVELTEYPATPPSSPLSHPFYEISELLRSYFCYVLYFVSANEYSKSSKTICLLFIETNKTKFCLYI